MGTEIYYFSGTGNSLVVARDIAEKLEGKLLLMSSLSSNKSITINAEIIGIVFPVYHQGVPNIVKRFIFRINNLENKYIFGVCTYGDSPGITIKYLKNIVNANNGNLAAGFAVNMPYNYLSPSFVLNGFFKFFSLREIHEDNKKEMFYNWKKKLNNICNYIRLKKSGKYETEAELIESLVDYLNLRETIQKYIWLKIAGFNGDDQDLTFRESIKVMDYGFNCTVRCNSCSICSKICPVNNIKMADGRPVWQHHCEQCFACLQWCPEKAIQFRKGTFQCNRYHHPEVTLSDMMEGMSFK